MINVISGLAALVLLGSAFAEPEAAKPRTPPLIRGTLWWVTQQGYSGWTQDQFAKEIETQRAVGFDVLWILNTPSLFKDAVDNETAGKPYDAIEMILTVADAKGMKVIVDLPTGGWYGKTPAEDMIATLKDHVDRFHARYGRHPSLWGWYLNHEINPIAPDGVEETAYWRTVWRATAQACHAKAPKSVVTISPFFLLDEPRRRGFVYLTPQQYAGWWGETLTQTGIDILMLQDSGEHLSFFTLEQREPFFAAVAEACHKAGARFWVNVETGEADVAGWDQFLALSAEQKVPWRFTPIEWLEKKLALAARYGDGIINWGYYPYMDPTPIPGQEKEGSKAAYAAYKAYYERIRKAGGLLPPLE